MANHTTEEFTMNWEEAVQWARSREDQQLLVEACYFDDPIEEAAQRFYESVEWQETKKYIPEGQTVLDIGSGRGISAYALAKDGWTVTALEPDSSDLTGCGSIRKLKENCGLPISIVNEWGETLPFSDEQFDFVYCRQVLHHANNLASFMKEVSRVLKPGGSFIALREHVVDTPEDLDVFLKSHPLHKFYGGENAFPLPHYISCIQDAGLYFENILQPFDNILNIWPASEDYILNTLESMWRWKCAPTRTDLVENANRNYTFPGRIFSFFVKKPLSLEKNDIERLSQELKSYKIISSSLLCNHAALINKNYTVIVEQLAKLDDIEAKIVDLTSQSIQNRDNYNNLKNLFRHPFRTIGLKILRKTRSRLQRK